MKKLSFEEWYDLNEEEMYINFAETGATRELDYDPELLFEQAYQEYLNE
jgi:hypothetical protein